jgi:hypothetical protein
VVKLGTDLRALREGTLQLRSIWATEGSPKTSSANVWPGVVGVNTLSWVVSVISLVTWNGD